jgi:hypothetical protein
MRANPKPRRLDIFLSLLLLCSGAATPEPSALVPASELPADVAMNKSAGQWGLLFLTLRLENGRELPFVVDTGSSWTMLDKSLEPTLGKRLDTITITSWDVKQAASVYAAPKLYLGGTPLDMSTIVTCDFRKLRFPGAAGGILGMDFLKHYCIQLDFEAGKIRFLDPYHVNAAALGKAFALTLSRGNLPTIHHASLSGGKATEALIDTGYYVDGVAKKGAAKADDSGTVRLAECVWDGRTYRNLIVRADENASLLGLRFLARHLVTFDFPHRTMYLKQTSVGPLVDEDIEAAIAFLKGLKAKGQVPGWSKDDHGSIYADADSGAGTLNARKNGDSSIFHYQLTHVRKDSPWSLQKAWRTDEHGQTIEEYPIP